MKIKLKKIINNDYKELYKITSNIDIMKYVGNGKIWDLKKTKIFIKYSIEEQKYSNKIRTNFFYKIILNKKLIGIIGIHKYDNENDYNLTTFIDKKYQGKGYGTKVLLLILKKIIKIKKNIKKIVSQMLIDNISSEKSCKNVGFIFRNIIIRNNKKYKEYVYYTKLHKIFKLEYPYLKYFISKQDIFNSFKLLQNYKPIIQNGSINKFSSNMRLIIDFDKEKNINQITDYFTDKCRVRCLFKNKKYTPLEFYSKNRGELIKKSIKNKKFDIIKFESVMFGQTDSKFCNNFQITIAFTLYKLFKAKNIFDSSAGWGDRLVAALAYGASYTGIDPSKCLKPLYKKIIDTLVKKENKDRYEIINKGVENVDVRKGYYDLCLTSPPFFDLEIYENNKNQSINKFLTEYSWETKFLIILVKKNIKALKKNGHLAIYISGNYKYFMNYMMKHQQLMYCGIFSFITPKKRDIFVWKKK